MNQAGMGVKLCRHPDDRKGQGLGGALGSGKSQLGWQRLLCSSLRRAQLGPDGPEKRFWVLPLWDRK